MHKRKAILETALCNIAVDFQQTTNQILTQASKSLIVTKPGRKFINKQIWWWNDQVQAAVQEKRRSTNSSHLKPATTITPTKVKKSAAKAAVAQPGQKLHSTTIISTTICRRSKTPTEFTDWQQKISTNDHAADQKSDGIDQRGHESCERQTRGRPRPSTMEKSHHSRPCAIAGILKGRRS